MSDKTREFAEKVCENRGWKLNTDSEFLETVLQGLDTNRSKYGYYLCPCREGWGIRDKDRDIICPCEYAQEDIDEAGHCYCGLFLSEEFAESGNRVWAIPERRPDEFFPD